jgi:hypothetical protein
LSSGFAAVRRRDGQFMLQAPGPRGSPQRPHPAGIGAGLALAALPPRPIDTTDSTRSTRCDEHSGQGGVALADETSSSKGCEHFWQTYS